MAIRHAAFARSGGPDWSLTVEGDYDDANRMPVPDPDGDGGWDLSACDFVGPLTITVTGRTVRVWMVRANGNTWPPSDRVVPPGVYTQNTGGQVRKVGDLRSWHAAPQPT